MIRTENGCEKFVAKTLEEQGFEVIKNGWPDFVAVDWNRRKVRFIEVKPGKKHLKPRQIKMQEIFRMVGLNYEVYYVDLVNGVQKIRTATKSADSHGGVLKTIK